MVHHTKFKVIDEPLVLTPVPMHDVYSSSSEEEESPKISFIAHFGREQKVGGRVGGSKGSVMILFQIMPQKRLPAKSILGRHDRVANNRLHRVARRPFFEFALRTV